ncbi:MAG TPA: hypothetical protein VMU78_05545 [Methylocella sp.]|nr:hypothetical protein [Methylocella sp.]
MTDGFNWNDVEDDLVLSEQLAVAVYENPMGNTIIRQAADSSRDEDSIIIINRSNLATFVAALQRHLKNQQDNSGHP